MNHPIASIRRALNTFLCLTLSTLLFGCGGGGGGGSPSPSPLPSSSSSSSSSSLSSSSSSSSSQPQQAPAAPTVAVSYGVKQVILNWTAVNGATYYKVLKNPTGTAGFTQIGSNLNALAVSFADTLALHLTDWVHIKYIVAACNSVGCTNSVEINSFDPKQAIGYFKASNAESPDLFGTAVALSADGNTLAVGAKAEASDGINGDDKNNNQPGSGAVYVFIRSGANWIQQAYLKPSKTNANDNNFGIVVALSADGNTLAVAARNESGNATGINSTPVKNDFTTKKNSGAVYVFTRSGTTWSTQETYIKASNAEAQDHFGSALALSADGNTLAVGALTEDSNSTVINGGPTAEADNSNFDSGAVYVFTRSSTIWTQQAYIKASNSDKSAQFGAAVALSDDGNTMAVGANRESGNGTDAQLHSGAVYVFIRSGITWMQQPTILKASTIHVDDSFGVAVALSGDGNALAVGSSLEDTTAMDSGAVYVFIRSGTSWSLPVLLKASKVDANDQFGSVVALSHDGNTLAVGATGEDSNAKGINTGDLDNNDLLSSGAVYVFTRNGSSWSQPTIVKASNTDAGDMFGSSVALNADGTTLVVGAVGESSKVTTIDGDQLNNDQPGSGAVYMY